MSDNTDIKSFLLDLIFPNRCPLCGNVINWRTEACRVCIDKLPYTGKEFCNGCGNTLKKCVCDSDKLYFLRCYAAFYYEGSGKGGVVYLKRTKNELFPRLFAEKIISDIEKDAYKFKADCIVPVPMSRMKLRKRGFNQAEVLADALALKLGIPVINDALIKRSSFVAQHKLSAAKREENAAKIYSEGNPDPISGKKVIIVDDVITTGSTLNSCAEILINMGAAAVVAAAAAATV